MPGGQGLQINERDRAIHAYYAELGRYEAQEVDHEQALRTAFSNLLSHFAQQVKWTLIPELTLANGKRPDGTLRDTFNLPRGYWEAKDTHDDLDAEIRKKIAAGYPTTNTIFEDTRHAVLYQAGRPVGDKYDLRLPRDLAALLSAFFGYTERAIATFAQAVEEFRERIPDLAAGLVERIEQEHAAHNPAFRDAWAAFYGVCKASIDPNIRSETVDEMLVQHLLTERLFRTVFNNADFVQRNVIAAEIEKVIQALTIRAFNRAEFLSTLDRFYIAIEDAARDLRDWRQKQDFMNTVYERFFQGFSREQADTHGIVYTPQAIVDFMLASVDEVLQHELGASLSSPGVQILDPATGTGNYIANLISRLDGATLEAKYRQDLFANEVMLLPYYIAALNIEHAYYERTGHYASFDGLCFVDTLDLADRVAHMGLGERSLWMTEANSTRVAKEQDAKIVVVIGNPPYNVGQDNENDNNKNRRYPVVDGRIRETYVKDSSATSNSKLYDAYTRFFRWASDRLQGRDGVVCFVSNNSFVDQVAFDGMRHHLMQDFTAIYHLDLHGNVRKNPKLSGSTHNVFGIQVGVGVTIAIRAQNSPTRGLFYYRVPEDWRKEEKWRFLEEQRSWGHIDWRQLSPDERHTWLTDGMRPEFSGFLPIGTKEAKAVRGGAAEAIFATYSLGVNTARDQWMYDFDSERLRSKARRFIETYNAEVDRWRRRGSDTTDVDSFVLYDDKRIKWSRDLKLDLKREHYANYSDSKIRLSQYRPFCRQHLFFDRILDEEVYQQQQHFPTQRSEGENFVVIVGSYDRKDFSAQAASCIPNLNFYADPAQCFPLYIYDEDGSNRRENITDWALAQFREAYGAEVSKRDIFAYVYGMLHHPTYRERYAENLKHELPRIPLLPTRDGYEACVRVGSALLALHLDYETLEPWPLALRETPGVPIDWRVKRMRLIADKAALVYNDWLTLDGIPPEAFAYRLGNRSALEWVVDQYHVDEDKRTGITSDPNRAEDPQYIVRLVGQVVRVSMETVRLVRGLAVEVTLPEPVTVGVVAE